VLALAVLLAVLPVALLLPFRWIAPPATAFMLEYRFGGDGGARAYQYRWVSWNEISSWVPLAMVAAEDQKFPVHAGFDVESIRSVLAANAEHMRGASTISQQTVKNLLLWNGRSYVRKAIEAYLTVWLELLWPKKRILEVYVNVAEMGPGVYGVDAASRAYFRRAPAHLGPAEAALLAAVLPDPTRLSAAHPSSYVRQRVAWIQGQMRSLGGPGYIAGL
jgi:monofunctional biosynthetic peptidoglycan transglycosylase